MLPWLPCDFYPVWYSLTMTNANKAKHAEAAERLAEIKDEIKELIREADRLLPKGITRDRARSYWYPHIVSALDDDHGYMARSMCSMQDTINELTADDEEESS